MGRGILGGVGGKTMSQYSGLSIGSGTTGPGHRSRGGLIGLIRSCGLLLAFSVVSAKAGVAPKQRAAVARSREALPTTRDALRMMTPLGCGESELFRSVADVSIVPQKLCRTITVPG